MENILKDLCYQYKIYRIPKLILCESLEDGSQGRYDYRECTITISKAFSKEIQISSLHHEFRHHYQYIFYPEIYLWWYDHHDIYIKYYRFACVTIEEDAKIFGNSLGKYNVEFLLIDYTVDILERFRISDRMLELHDEILPRYSKLLRKARMNIIGVFPS